MLFKDDGVRYDDAIKKEVDKKILKEIEIILKQYHVAKWDEFHKFDKNVLDGDCFSSLERAACPVPDSFASLPPDR